jgi:hypothetical protein
VTIQAIPKITIPNEDNEKMTPIAACLSMKLPHFRFVSDNAVFITAAITDNINDTTDNKKQCGMFI